MANKLDLSEFGGAPQLDLSEFESPPPAGKGILGHARDLGLAAARSAIAVPEIAVGAADLLSGGKAGKTLENQGGVLGFRPKQAKEFLSSFETDKTKAQRQEFASADGVLAKTGVALANPSLITNTITESAAPMLAGGLVGRGVKALGLAKTGATAAAIGEGATMASSAAEQIRQQTDDGLLTGKQTALALGTGLVGTAVGAAGNKLGQAFGDVDSMIVDGAAKMAIPATARSLPTRIAGGAAVEGAEELAQSVPEQVMQNAALGKPLGEGVEDAAVMGTLAGVAMGAGAGGVKALSERSVQVVPPQAAPAAEAPGPQPGPTEPGPQPGFPPDTPTPEPVAPTPQPSQQTGMPVPEVASAAGPATQGGTPPQAGPGAAAQPAAQAGDMAPSAPAEQPGPNLMDSALASARAGIARTEAAWAAAAEQHRAKRMAVVGVADPAPNSPLTNAAIVAVDSGAHDLSVAAQAAAKPAGQVQAGPVANAAQQAMPAVAMRQTPALAAPVAPVEQAQVVQVAPPQELTRAPEIATGPARVLQNRDRSTAASIAQMNDIAKTPDYYRAGQARVMDSGAPVVFGSTPASALFGKADQVTDGLGQRVPVQYAVVEAADVLPSHQADGTPIPGYENGIPGKLRAVAGNGRAAGIAAGYGRGSAAQYRQDLIDDAASMGIDPEAVSAMAAPVLVRVMPEELVTDDIGDRSNIASTAALSPTEQAANDTRRIDLSALSFDEAGIPNQQSIAQFVAAMPVGERGTMLQPDGSPTRQLIDRITSAAFKAAYGNDEVVRLQAQSTDTEIRNIITAMASVAGPMAGLEGAGDFDIRGAVAEAAQMAVNAKRSGATLTDYLNNADINFSGEAFTVAKFMADNIRSAKRMAEGLRAWADYAAEQVAIARENETQGAMFGPTPTASRGDTFNQLGATSEQSSAAQIKDGDGRSSRVADRAPRQEAQSDAEQNLAGDFEAQPVQVAEAVTQQSKGVTNEKADQAQPQQTQPETNAATVPDEVARPDGWRNNRIAAGAVARKLGIDAKGMSLSDVVAAVERADDEASLTDHDRAMDALAKERDAMQSRWDELSARAENLDLPAAKQAQVAFESGAIGEAEFEAAIASAELEASVAPEPAPANAVAKAQAAKAKKPTLRESAARAKAAREAAAREGSAPEGVARPAQSQIAANSDAAQIASAVEYADRLGLTGGERSDAILSELAGAWSMTPDEVRDVAAVKDALRKKPGKKAKAAATNRFVEDVKRQAIEANREMEAQADAASTQDAPAAPNPNSIITKAKAANEKKAKAAELREFNANWQKARGSKGFDTWEEMDKFRTENRESLASASAALKKGNEELRAEFAKFQEQREAARAQAAAPDTLTSPTPESLATQQERRDNADTLDKRAQIDREREASDQAGFLQAQTAPEQRQDTSGDMFGMEKAQAEIDKRNAGQAKKADEGQGDIFAEPAQKESFPPTKKVTKKDAKAFFDGMASAKTKAGLKTDGKAFSRFIETGSEAEFQALLARRKAKENLSDDEENRFYDLRKERNDAIEGDKNAWKEERESGMKSNPVQAPATQAAAILDAANITGKERIEAIKDVKKGDVTPEELEAAYPPASPAPANDLGAMFDDLMGEIAPAAPKAATKPKATRQNAPPKQAPKPRTATQAAGSAAKNTAAALANAIDGLGALFGAKSKGRIGSGLSFDEDTYAQAKPLFIQAVANLKDAASDIREAMRAVISMVTAKFGRETTENMKPYIVRFASDVRDGTITQEELNAASTDGSVERDSAEPAAEPAVGDTVSPDTRDAGVAVGEAGGPAGAEAGRGQQDRASVPFGSAPVARERGDQPVSAGNPAPELESILAGSDFREPGGDSGIAGVPPEPIPAGGVATAADTGNAGLKAGIERARADKAPVKLGDIESIRATLPQLLPGQQDDVFKAEQRFSKPDGYGILFTNGTGTGKTFTGLGIIKRFARQGKTNILIAVPDDKIAADWIDSGKVLGLEISKLKDIKDAGKGIVITSYANMGANDALATRKWDLVVADEAHTLAQDKDGTPTTYLQNLRAITHHPDGAHQRYVMLNRADIDRAAEIASNITSMTRDISAQDTTEMERASLQTRREKLQAEMAALTKRLDAAREAVRVEVSATQGAARARLAALSATPFAYEKTIDWANGYLFDYNEGQRQDGASGTGGRTYNSGSNRERFFMRHFGYSMRHNKLTTPDAKVDSGLMQRQFNTMLKRSGALSGRMLDVKPDYDRRFVLVDSAIGNRIDEALSWLNDRRKGSNGFASVADAINGQFEYLQKRYLLEAIKANEVIPIVKRHLAMGRKVVVFHDYKKGGGFNPFKVNVTSEAGVAEAVAAFNAEFGDLVNSNLGGMDSPIEVFKRELPGTLLVNGNEKKADLLARYKQFQDDATGPQVMLVQSAKNKGWSGHDTTGKHQRVLINLGQPTAPTLAIQQEGRIYRTGQASDAIMRYLNTGTNWERWTFATTIAGRASTAENLGMGEQARALKDSFVQSFDEADTYAPGHEGEGKGGKERDKAANNALSEYDRAKTLYWASQKKTARTKAQEGIDYFATPEPVGLKMVQWLDARNGEDLMEPSGGHGAIARWLPERSNKTVIEPSTELRSRLALVMNATEDRIIAGTFEDHAIQNKYDGIAMNPPFGTAGRTAIDHLAKAATHLRDGGRIVAVIPTGPAADAKFDKWFYESESRPTKPLYTHPEFGPIHEGDTLTMDAFGSDLKIGGPLAIDGTGFGPRFVRPKGETKASAVNLVALKSIQPGKRTEEYRPAADLYTVADIKLPSSTFERAGTSVMTRIVVIEKQSDQALAPQPRNIDLSDIKDIAELFDRLEDLNLPARPKVDPVGAVETKAPAKTEKPARAEKPMAELGATVTLDGKPYTVTTYTTNAGKVLRGAWLPTKPMAERFGSTFQKRGEGWFVREANFPAGAVTAAAPVPAFSRATAATPGMTPAQVQAIADRISANWTNAPEIIVAANMADESIPQAARDEDQRQRAMGATGSPEGFVHEGVVYLLADNIPNATRAAEVLLHETIGHIGLQGVFGDNLKTILRQIATMRRADVTAKAKQYGLDMTDPVQRLQAAEEVLAEMAQSRPEIGFVKRAIAAIRNWLRANMPGFSGLQLTDADIAQAYLIPARGWIERGRAAVAGGSAAFSRGAADQTGTPAFKKWFGDSKVVDADGNQLVVYHGSASTFDEFDRTRLGSNTGYGDAEIGFHFSDNRADADLYASMAAEKQGAERGIVRPFYLSLRNPLIVGLDETDGNAGDRYQDFLDDKIAAKDYAEQNGMDGVIYLYGTNVDSGYTAIAFNPEQIKSADGNNGDFDGSNPDIRFSRSPADIIGAGVDRARDTLNAMAGRNDARAADMSDLDTDQRALLGKIGASRTPTADAIKSATDRAGLKIRQGIVDRYASLKELDERTLGADFLDAAITDSSWVLAKMASAAGGALNSMMTVGRIRYNAGQKVIEMQGEPDGGLTGVLKKLGPPAEVERFFAWVAANRAFKLMDEKRENLFTEDEIIAGMALNTNNTEAGQPRAMLYAQAFADFQRYRDDVLAIAESAGIISEENRALWRDEFYVPFYRVMDEDAKTGGPAGGGGLSRQEAFKRLKGGKQNLNDLMENTLMNFHHLLSASLKNQAAAQAIKNAERVGLAHQVPESRRDTKTSTFILDGGKKAFYQVDDALVFESLTSLSDPGLNSTAVQVMGAFKRVFTNLTTVTPQFVIANTFRDLLQASATSPTSKNIGKNLAQGIKNYRDEKTRAEMLASGGAFSFGHIYSMDAEEVKASLRKTVAGAELISHPSMIPGILRKGWNTWGDIIDTSENISRAATYAQNVGQLGKLRAAFEARDVMDFSQHGAWPAVRFLIRVVPFLNARLQGLDKLYRSGVKPAILTAMGKGSDTDKQAAARFAMVTGALTVATMALYLLNADDDEYKKLEEWQKDTYWFFRIGNNAFFLPKPFEVGAIATLAERTLQQAMDDKATGKLFAERVKEMLMQTFAFNPMPQLFQPALDIYSNKDAFTGRDIETFGMERLSPGLRARDTTTAPARALSAATRVFGDESPAAISPVQADHLIKGYLGGVGASAAGILDTMHRAATGQESPDKRFVEYQPIRRFYRDLESPVANTRYSTLFYDGLREANRVYADVQELQKLGRQEDANELAARKRNVLQMRVGLNAQQRRLTDIGSRLKEVNRSDKDGAWKRREVDLLNTQRALITERMGKIIESERAAR